MQIPGEAYFGVHPNLCSIAVASQQNTGFFVAVGEMFHFEPAIEMLCY